MTPLRECGRLPAALLLLAAAAAGQEPATGDAAPAVRPRLHVAFTMDCERIRAECPCGGPADWETSARAIAGFCARLVDAGFPPTLFVVPESAERHAELLRHWASRGVEIGMHLHPQCYGDGSIDRYLAQLDAPAQADLLAAARDRIAAAVGTAPRAFRPGNFSADATTLRIASELGFTHGSCSDPGRRSPQFAAVWVGADPDVHWASATDALRAGSLPLLEFPVTTDPAQPPNRHGFPRELRLESGDFATWHRPILQRALARMREEGTRFCCLTVFTHDYWDYGDPQEPRRRRLDAFLAELEALRASYEVTGATLSDLRARYVADHGSPAPGPGDGRGGSGR